MKYKYIVWDWNGTLYDDVGISIDAMNEMLKIEGYNNFLTADRYQEIFGFPVKDYYRRVGFDFDKHPFEELAQLYIDIYSAKQKYAALYPDAKGALDRARELGIEQTVVSACEKNRLLFQIGQCGISDYFKFTVGINDNLAHGKSFLAKKWMSDNSVDPESALFIGDTEHDLETASFVGSDCVLVSHGHESYNRLKSYGVPVVSLLDDIFEYM